MSRYLVPIGVSAKLLSLAIRTNQQARTEALQAARHNRALRAKQEAPPTPRLLRARNSR